MTRMLFLLTAVPSGFDALATKAPDTVEFSCHPVVDASGSDSSFTLKLDNRSGTMTRIHSDGDHCALPVTRRGRSIPSATSLTH